MIAWLVETLIVTSGLVLCVLLLRNPVRDVFGSKVAYALWLLPALRMIMPPINSFMPETLPIAGITPSSGAISQLIRNSMLAPASGTTFAETNAGAGILPWILAASWLLGALSFAVWQVISYRRFCQKVLAGARVRRSPARGIKLMASTQVNGPMAFGLTKRFIVFPEDAMMRFDVEEHAMALAHELAHHHRGDLFANAAALGFLALHWWNPIAWHAHRAFRTDQEMACDADVIDAIRDRGLGHAYGRALVKCASGRELSAICHLTTVDRLKRRLSMLSKQSPSASRRLMGVALTGAVVLTGLALTASGECIAAAQVGAKASKALPMPYEKGLVSSLRAVPAASAEVSDEQRAEQEAHWAEADAVRAEADAARMEADAARAEADDRRFDAMPVPPAPPAPPAIAAAPPIPPVPPAPAMAPPPPVPPVPPVKISRQSRAVTTSYARYAPSAAEIEAMVPIVEVTEGRGCAGSKSFVNSSETTVSVDGKTRKRISIQICGKDIERQARSEAMQGLQQARADMARDDNLSMKLRREIMADLDREIAKLRSGRD